MRPELREILSGVLEVDRERIDESASPDTIPSWDSLGHLQLVSALEKHYNVRFNLREIQTMDSAANIEAILVSKLGSEN